LTQIVLLGHDGNLGRSPGMDSEWTIPGRYSVVECCLNVDKISVNTNIIYISRSTYMDVNEHEKLSNFALRNNLK
jgi:hypothetical protein